jgi:predicted 2-oxoglutarate/Fe(II)-dependent dioxygenase YbiX
MQIKKHYHGIYEVEDFLTQDEVSGMLLSAKPEGFFTDHPHNIIQNMTSESLSLIPTISKRLMSYFDNAHSHTPINNVRRLTENEYMNIHSDGGNPKNPQRIVFGIAIYLNDDFEGGELYYPDLDISIKPKVGSMVVHESHFLHEVLTVRSGNRYSITTFIFGDRETSIKF